MADLTPHVMADALDAFWNASIGEAHALETSAAMHTACVVATGLAAVAAKLREPSPPAAITEEQLATFKRAFYQNTGDDTDDPFTKAFEAMGWAVE